MIFVSGKIVITGAKKEEDLSKALTKLYPVLVEFKKVHVAPFPAVPNLAIADQADVQALTDKATTEKQMEEV